LKSIGIIGYGGFGAFIHRAWDAMDNARVVAVCDSDPKRKPRGVRFYTQVTEMLADGDIDIVSIATPPNTHHDLAIRCLKAGKAALIEKPLALNKADCADIIRVSEATGIPATVNFVLRQNPIVLALIELARSEALGKLRRVDLRNYATLETVPRGHWFWEPDVSGRILLEHGVHFFDLARAVVGADTVKEWSMGVEREPGMEDRVFAAVEYENGVVGTFWHSFTRPKELERTTMHFAFDLGEIDIIGWIPLELKAWGWTDEKGLAAIRSICPQTIATPRPHQLTQSSEFTYPVDYDFEATLVLDKPKLDIYADGVRAVMADLIQAIEDPNHRMTVTLEDGAAAVRTAARATRAAHSETK
jgi:predicted dehydrogenase